MYKIEIDNPYFVRVKYPIIIECGLPYLLIDNKYSIPTGIEYFHNKGISTF